MSARDKVIYGLAVVFIIASFFMYADAQKAEQQIAETESQIEKEQKDLKHLEVIGELYKSYGRGSSDFYAEVPLIVLNKGGKTKNIPVYWGTEGEYHFEWATAISVKDQKDWNNHKNNFTVTSGEKRGCYKVGFSNKVNSDAFEVLVVVK